MVCSQTWQRSADGEGVHFSKVLGQGLPEVLLCLQGRMALNQEMLRSQNSYIKVVFYHLC